MAGLNFQKYNNLNMESEFLGIYFYCINSFHSLDPRLEGTNTFENITGLVIINIYKILDFFY